MDYSRSKRFLDALPDWEVGRTPVGPPEAYLPRVRALLARLDNPQRRFRSVIVGGTNGKGTVGSLLAALLRGAGFRVGLYTSPHLHTVRERIQVDGQLSDKERWAEGVTRLYERSRGFEAEGYGPFSKFEALTALAAQLFAAADVAWGVFEVGLGGRYDATNAWDSELAVLTSIGLDHTEVLGDTLEAIAADKFHIARPGRPLCTPATQAPQVLALLRRESAAQGVDLYVVGADGVETPPGRAAVQPPALPILPGRPATYVQNARLALAAAQLLLEEALEADSAIRTVASHVWPGRFEVVRQSPWVVVDGAHNPAGAAALAADLKAISNRWTFVVGMGRGHDAAGILNALSPLAREVVLTQSGHPKAVRPEDLLRCTPSGVPVRCASGVQEALEGLVESLAEGDCLCVTGSLHLAARAREVLRLPFERDGFGEEVSLESQECLVAACENLGVDIETVSKNENVLRIFREGRPLYFLRNKHPFNDYVGARLAEDKAYQYELFRKAGLQVPDTLTVFNPFADARFDRYKTHMSVEAVVEEAAQRFVFPVVVKKNGSSLAQGVYLVNDPDELARRLQELWENSGFYDNVLLLQSFVRGPEYRAVGSREELLLAYEKTSDPVNGAGDINPLHQDTGQAVKVTDPALLAMLEELVGRVCRTLDLGFYALDLILAEDGPYILEINPNPMCYFYNSHNGRADFVRIYERLLQKFGLVKSDRPDLRLAVAGKA